MTPSIRSRLLVALLTAFVGVWAVAVFLTYLNVREQVTVRFDEQLARNAQVLWLWYDTAEQPEALSAEPYAERFLARFGVEQAFQVWNGNRLVARSANAPAGRMASGYAASTGELGGEPWRFHYRVDALRGLDVIVGTRLAERSDLVRSLVLGMVWPLLAGLPLVAVLIVLAVGAGLRPLRRVAEGLALRSPDALEPLTEAAVPREVQPLTRALNELLARLDRALDGERRFTADASHELRTPLAALKTQAQNALRAPTDAERREVLEALIAGVDRASRLVEQLLVIARLDPEAAAEGREPAQLHALAADVLADLDATARARGVELVLQAVPSIVQGRPAALAVMLRNLVDNAIRHSPQGAVVEVAVAPVNGGVELTVSDAGEGIPAEQRARVFDRFYRRLGQTEAGSGLGLSIVRRVAELHEAEVSLEDARADALPPGLRVRVRFPPAAAP